MGYHGRRIPEYYAPQIWHNKNRYLTTSTENGYKTYQAGGSAKHDRLVSISNILYTLCFGYFPHLCLWKAVYFNTLAGQLYELYALWNIFHFKASVSTTLSHFNNIILKIPQNLSLFFFSFLIFCSSFSLFFFPFPIFPIFPILSLYSPNLRIMSISILSHGAPLTSLSNGLMELCDLSFLFSFCFFLYFVCVLWVWCWG